MPDRFHERNKAEGGRLENVFGSLLVRRFTVRQPEMYRVVKAVFQAKLTSLDEAALCELAQAVMDLEYDDLDGGLLQAGCGGGGAAIVIAHAKKRNRAFAVHDPFAADAGAETRVREALAEHGADEKLHTLVVPGAYADTVASEGPLALAHLDSNKYESMRVLLERVTPRLVPGGELVIDDYSKEDCKRAVDEYFRGKAGFKFVKKSRLHVIKN